MFVEIKIDHYAQHQITVILISRGSKGSITTIHKNLLPTTAAFEAMPAAMKPRTTSSQMKPMRPMITTIKAVSLKL